MQESMDAYSMNNFLLQTPVLVEMEEEFDAVATMLDGEKARLRL